MVRKGIKTFEFWTTILVAGLAIFWPDFPKESLAAIIAWVGGRAAQKSFGFVDPVTGVRSYATSEFWVAIGYSVLITVFPDIPKESVYLIITYILGRSGTKALENFNVPPKVTK